ncbi:hypothetical protein DFH11DRAFT_1587482 [Phellopilus nigrolimitatus]|nr:hypothetical protein DFH11DRAFT_1587482 [Phellopilus nigrolimitatus]
MMTETEYDNNLTAYTGHWHYSVSVSSRVICCRTLRSTRSPSLLPIRNRIKLPEAFIRSHIRPGRAYGGSAYGMFATVDGCSRGSRGRLRHACVADPGHRQDPLLWARKVCAVLRRVQISSALRFRAVGSWDIAPTFSLEPPDPELESDPWTLSSRLRGT